MKKNVFLVLILLLTVIFILTGCGPAAAPEPQISPTTAPPVVDSTSTPAPAPSATAAPTAPPEPLACTIAFDSDRDGNREIYMMKPDGKDAANLTNTPQDDFAPAWSPDGSQIAFVSNRENGQEGGQFIYVMNADGSGVRQLSFENGSNWPDWSHDGSRITYTSNDDIYVIDAEGSGQAVNLTGSPEKDAQPAWSPDDSQIAWLSGSDGNWNIFLMKADGSDVRQLTNDGKVSDVAWTVDGQLFTHWDNQEAGCFNCVMDADGSNVVDAGGKGEIQRYLPFWTADGKRVECVAASLDGGDNEIYLVGEMFPDVFLNLTDHPADDRNPDWPANCGPGTGAAVSEASQPADLDKIVIGYAGDDPFQPQRKSNFQKACDELGIECIYGEASELIEKGVDAIVQNSNAIAVDGLFSSITEAREKSIPVFVLDAESNAGGAYNVTIDHHVWAKTGLGWMLEKIGEGQIAYFDLHPFNSYADTINDLLARYPGITVVEYRDGKYDREKVKPETVDFVRAYPGLKGVWTSFNINRAINGLEEEAGLPQERWPLVLCEATLDGLSTWMRIRTDHPNFECIALANPPGIAYDAVYAAYYLVTGARMDEAALEGDYGNTMYVDVPVITDDNLQEWLERAKSETDGGDSVDAWMSPDEIREKWFVD